MGEYTRVLSGADLSTLDYFARAHYVGATVLDNPYSRGVVSMVEADILQIEEVDATDQIRDSVLTDATRFAGANVATILAAVDTEVASILAAVDTEVAAIKAKTDNLPTDPADESNTQAAITAVLAAIAALNNPSTAAIVTAIFAGTMEGRAFEEIIKDIWAQVVGDFVANDDDDPTSIVYEGPNGATQLTHAITDTTRSWS